MDGPEPAAAGPGATLSQILKRLRRRRGLCVGDAAAALGMPLRSYEYFEAGRGRLNLPRILAAARALNADPYVLFLAVDLGLPELALRCAENKLGVVFSVALEAFDQAVGDDLVLLDPQTLLAAFQETFRQLAAEAARRAGLARGERPPPPAPDAAPG